MVLESRHLVGVFLAAVVLGGVFFTLGYVLGRSQQADVKAGGPSRSFGTTSGLKAAEPVHKDSAPNMEPVIAPGDWDFYKKAEQAHGSGPRLAPAPPLQNKPSGQPLEKKSKTTEPSSQAVAVPTDAKTIVQVAALKNVGDAQHLAARLKRKHYAAFVASSRSDGYYRVQVGPFADARAAEAVRKKLEQDGFKAIVRH